jgi:hypothetical protein
MAQNLSGRGHGHDDTTSLSFLIMYRQQARRYIWAKSNLEDAASTDEGRKQILSYKDYCFLESDAMKSSKYCIYVVIS